MGTLIPRLEGPHICFSALLSRCLCSSCLNHRQMLQIMASVSRIRFPVSHLWSPPDVLVPLQHRLMSGGWVTWHLWAWERRTQNPQSEPEEEPDVGTTVTRLELGPGQPTREFHVCAQDFSGPGDQRIYSRGR